MQWTFTVTRLDDDTLHAIRNEHVRDYYEHRRACNQDRESIPQSIEEVSRDTGLHRDTVRKTLLNFGLPVKTPVGRPTKAKNRL